jgi:hypothetical protein
MTKVALVAWLALSTFPAVDADQQPACRERCQVAYAEELAACEQAQRGVDMCRDEARDRHQECIDRCND